MGLNDSFTNIKTQIILIKSIPILSEVYALVQQEKKRKQVSIGLNINDLFSLAVITNFNTNRDNNSQFWYQKRKMPYYTNCKISGHLLDRCFKVNLEIYRPFYFIVILLDIPQINATSSMVTHQDTSYTRRPSHLVISKSSQSSKSRTQQ